MKLARVRNPETGRIERGAVEGSTIETGSGVYPLEEIELLTPVKPGKIICVGLNYRDHITERGSEVPERPSLFFKPASAVIGPNDPIRITEAERFDPEGEIAVVIGSTCQNVDRTEVGDYIWGYTGLNDVTNRDAQEWEQNWVRAKGFDTSAPLGPFLVTPGEIDLPISFELEVNGKIRQASDTSDLIFGFADLIAEISSFMTLEKGDVISTGTPEGVAPIKGGDRVKLKIDGGGVLENTVEYRSPPA